MGKIKSTIVAIGIGAFALLFGVGPAAASAVVTTPVKAAVTMPTHVTPDAGGTHVLGAPNGCPSGDFCVYRRGNGGELCGTFAGDAGNWGVRCANNNMTAFNNGNWCTGCQDVNIYWGPNQSGAYRCLGRGGFLLYMDLDHFDRGGPAGLGEAMGNNSVSHRWTTC
jgi:hypothetical protein